MVKAASSKNTNTGTAPSRPTADPAVPLPAFDALGLHAPIQQPAPAPAPVQQLLPPQPAPAPSTRVRGKISYVTNSPKGYHGGIRYPGRKNGKRAWLIAHLRPEECIGANGMPLSTNQPPSVDQLVEFDVEYGRLGARAVFVTGLNDTPVLFDPVEVPVEVPEEMEELDIEFL